MAQVNNYPFAGSSIKLLIRAPGSSISGNLKSIHRIALPVRSVMAMMGGSICVHIQSLSGKVVNGGVEEREIRQELGIC